MKRAERRVFWRFPIALPVIVRSNGPAGTVERSAETRDINFRGIYFISDVEYELGSPIELVLVLPKEITMANDVNIRSYGQVVRIEHRRETIGIAARIERNEFLSTEVTS